MKSNLTTKLATIQAEMKAKKSRYNGFGKYYYRAAEDILEAVKPFCVKHNVTVIVSEKMVSIDPPVMQSTAKIIDGESDNAIHAVAIVGVDLLSKGMSMPQKYGAASSYAKKYALGNLLLIDDTQDSDAGNNHSTDKIELKEDDNNWGKVCKYLQTGGNIVALKSKYSFDKTTEVELKKMIPALYASEGTEEDYLG